MKSPRHTKPYLTGTGLARLLALPALVAVLLGCAEIAPPPGGQEDKSGPRLLVSTPADGATMVEPGNRIEVVFNERITKPSKEGAVFISPRPEGDYKVDWKSDRVVVELEHEFEEDRTYVVTVASSLTDLRNNQLDSALSIAFSTGDHLDSGSISGTVLDAYGGALADWKVGLYRHLDPTDLLVLDSIRPDYLTTTGREGGFSFRNLPDDLFLLVAFGDKNRNNLFAATLEEFALADRPTDLRSDVKLTDLYLTSGRYDTLAPRITSVTRTKSGPIEIRLDRPVDVVKLGEEPNRIRVSALGPGSDTVVACGVLEDSLASATALSAWVGRLPEGDYAAALDMEPYGTLRIDSVHFGDPGDDDVAPEVVMFMPGKGNHFANHVNLSLTFSEPLDTSNFSTTSLMLWEDSLRAVPMERSWPSCFRLALKPLELKAGSRYRLEVTEFDLMDYSGNRLGDSIRSYDFATLDTDSLGSVSGRLRVLLPGADRYPAVLEFRNTGGRRIERLTVRPGSNAQIDSTVGRSFNIEVPAGKYLISGFLDANDDGTVTPGQAKPFQLGETRFLFADTVAVRARFETAGLDLTVD